MTRYQKSFRLEMIALYKKRKEQKTQMEFANEQNINLYTFKNWLRIENKKEKEKEKEKENKESKNTTKIIELKPVTIKNEKQTIGFSQPTWIGLSNGVEIQAPMTSMQQLVQLIKELQA